MRRFMRSLSIAARRALTAGTRLGQGCGPRIRRYGFRCEIFRRRLLEDAQIKLSVVASDIFGVSGRKMMAALIAGQRDPQVLAQLARGRMRVKITQLEEAFTGYFTDHHGFLLTKMLARVDALSADIAELETRIEEMVAPFGTAPERLDEIPGLGMIGASVVLAEIGLDMTRFPTAGHLASWAKFAPGVKESAGKKKGPGSTGHGNRYLAKVLGERYRRITRRRGKKRAIVALGRTILVIIWHLLSDPNARFTDLGSDFYDKRIDPERRKRTHIHQLEALGYKVTIEPAA
jgi:transposase